MISQLEFLDQLKVLFSNRGFSAYSGSSDKNKVAPALHQGIREVIGLKENDSVFMYWEWRGLKASVDTMWFEMDRAASEFAGRKTSLIALCSQPGFEFENLHKTFSLIEFENFIPFPKAVRRPTKAESQVRFVGKRLGAILATLGIATDLTSSGYGDLLATLANSGEDEIDLLDHLDRIVKREHVDVVALKPPSHVVILRALGRAFEKVNADRLKDEIPELNFQEFLRETEENSNWAGLSDKDVLRRLLMIAPEEADASKKAIEKFLSN